ncbi:glycosyltransferase family 4 protein [Mycoplasmoides alvi]|uniref:glycosyltransferase family 4 protein n=1 Tax=Mycoplasmoides alvi TaxID=78580 RepID=UPI00051B0AD8|nr:glycosyltransferase family 4 protein [Mycoplasmoides alvi]
MKKILILTHHNSNDIGGIERYVKNLIEIFTSNSYLVYEINIFSEKKYLNFAKHNYNYIYTPFFEKLNLKNKEKEISNKNIWKKIFYYFKFYLCELKNCFFIKKFVKQNKIDIVINNNFSTPLFFNKNTKYIWVQHFDEKIYSSISMFQKIIRKLLFIKNVLHYPNLVLFSQKDTKIFIEKKMVKKNTNIKDIVPAINFPIATSIPNWNIDFNKKLNISYIGRMENGQKNISFLNEIVELSIKLNKPINIHAYGTGLDENLLKNKKNIIFHGFINSEEIQDIYKETKILLLPSKFEGFPLVIVEALSHGIPCIISDTYLNASYLIDNSRGSLIPNFNANVWLNEIEKILNLSEIEYNQLSKKCYEFAKTNLNFQEFKNKWLSLIKNF